MYTNAAYGTGLQGFFLFDAAKTVFGAVKGAVTGAVQAVTGTGSQTGSTTPVYVQQPVAPAPNYTPLLLGGAAILGVVLLTQRRRR